MDYKGNKGRLELLGNEHTITNPPKNTETAC